MKISYGGKPEMTKAVVKNVADKPKTAKAVNSRKKVKGEVKENGEKTSG